MSSAFDQLQIQQLSVEERLQLIGQIWDSLSPPAQCALSPEQIAEIDARLQQEALEPNAGSAWEEVKERLLRGS